MNSGYLPQSPEFAVLIAALRRHAGNSVAAPDLEISLLNSARLLKLAGDHGLWGVLDRHWPLPEEAGIDIERARFAVSAISQRNACRNIELRQECVKLSRLLADAGIQSVFLKGSAFLIESADSAPWRVMADIDVLVPPDRAAEAYAVLLGSGFRATASDDRYREPDHQHLSPLLTPASGHMVELHTRLVWDKQRNPLDTEAIFAKSILAGAESLLIPSPDHRLVHLVAHAQVSDRNYAAAQITLKDAADLAVLSATVTDWSAVDSAFQAARLDRGWSSFRIATHRVLGVASPQARGAGEEAEAWAELALSHLEMPGASRRLLLIEMLRDYGRRLAANPGNILLAIRTLTDPERRAGFFGTQYRRWKR